jgi:hypothetical protein
VKNLVLSFAGWVGGFSENRQDRATLYHGVMMQNNTAVGIATLVLTVRCDLCGKVLDVSEAAVMPVLDRI